MGLPPLIQDFARGGVVAEAECLVEERPQEDPAQGEAYAGEHVPDRGVGAVGAVRRCSSSPVPGRVGPGGSESASVVAAWRGASVVSMTAVAWWFRAMSTIALTFLQVFVDQGLAGVCPREA